MNIAKATARYEDWLGGYVELVKSDLELKHELMAKSAFLFFRATFYRWIQIWPEICPLPAAAPNVLAVGDLHVENFGTWRDSEGRLVWGVNDFDEATTLPYTIDLVRLTASAILAAQEGHLHLTPKHAHTAVLEGYTESLSSSGHPFVLAENNHWLRDIATNVLRDPEHFWKAIDSYPRRAAKPPSKAVALLKKMMPQKKLEYRLVRRIAGMGSLGRVRIVAVAEWEGGRIAREAKSLAPSVAYLTGAVKGTPRICYDAILRRAIRCPDPWVRVKGPWIVRRLAPYCSRIELGFLPEKRDELTLLHAMGFETANIHLGTKNARKGIQRHLKTMKGDWLSAAAKNMVAAVMKDWRAWRESRK